ncbi:MAG TPA: glycosyltransferase [Chitinophagales bacterium]|jgi:glycosyltransferase involved in cell wall biosynthesis|nr:glycosyltransferase [Chitinophagales bacterium]MBP6154014.1 glycosyltransferase [Chitinophagales bacterium]HQV79301.1 glycosyltransferase [Chitinophagales bacterium]HQW80193.1 glycosyltransferase [Chitinophagales bacterium]
MTRIICTVTNDLVYDQRMQRICTSLQNNSYAVELVGRKLSNSPSLQAHNFQQTRLNCWFTKGVLFYAEFNIRLFIFLLFSNYDIACGCDLDTLPAVVLASAIKRKKTVYDAHEYFTESPELIGRPIKKYIWNFIEKLFVPHVDIAYTVSKNIAQLFEKKYKTKFHVIRNLPYKNTDNFYPTKNKILVYQGAVNIGRGLNELLLAMLKINHATCWIIGDGDEMYNVQNAVKELGLTSKVKLLGKKKPDELKRLTHETYIGINLLENRGLSYYYSLGNKTFDYIQAGKPQVFIGFPEYIELNNKYKFGCVVDELIPDKIQLAIDRLLNDDRLYQEIQQNCLRAREDLCWEKEELLLVSIYKKL